MSGDGIPSRYHCCIDTLMEQGPCSPKSALVWGTMVQKAWLAKAVQDTVTQAPHQGRR